MNAAEAKIPPETWVDQVKDALDHLYDLTHLQRHPITQVLSVGGSSTNVAAQRLRAELVDAIEALNPGKGTAFRAPHSRIYNLLTLHYVDKLTIRDAANELGISPRQADRGLRQGEQSVAEVLWSRRSVLTAPQPDAAETSSLHAEMALLSVRLRPIDLTALIEHCEEAVRPLAVQKRIRLQVETPAEHVTVSTDPLMAEQVLLTVLSRALGQTELADPRLSLEAANGQVSVSLRYCVDPGADQTLIVDRVVSELAERLRWTLTERDRLDGAHDVSIQMAACGPMVLVIDDNEGLISLLQRYLTDQTCRVVSATSGEEGLRLAQELRPAAIVLDIMMPVMHGWDVLQRLRANRQTADIPVIICSVINNPDLAQALGASLFLPKPIRQEDILSALDRLGVV
jgi:CheY-like chemotaxis protein